MFAGMDKLGGGVVGGVITERKVSMITMGESAATASAEETLVGKAHYADNEAVETVTMKSVVDSSSGGLSWIPVDAAVAAEDTISMSQMTSMLHDNDRNRKYETAITNAVQAFILEHGRPPVVLDIGCGTGLLSMLAVRGGAAEVIGCELYEPLAQVAREVTELNCEGKIKIVGKRSTDLGVGDGQDLPRRADMCVNEIYDSALLGEGCLPAVRHALANLLVDKPVMVPAGAGVQGLLLSSPSLRARHDLSEAEFTKGVPVARNARAAGCKGGRRALPLQGAEVEDAVHLSESFHALDFNFSEPFPEDGCRSRRVSVRAETAGVIDAVMMTWDLALHGDLTYSTRPGAENWQDHWCPSYYPVVGKVKVCAGDTVRLKVTHSDLNIMFEVVGVDANLASNHDHRAQQEETRTAASGNNNPSPPGGVSDGNRGDETTSIAKKGKYEAGYKMEREWDPEPCGCGWHVLCNPERISMMVDKRRREDFRVAISGLLQDVRNDASLGSTVCLDVSDSATCAFLAAGEGAAAVVSYEPAEWSHLLVEQVARNNDMENIHLLQSEYEWPFLKEVAVGAEEGGSAEGGGEGEGQQERLLCDALIGEPFYYRMQSLVLYQAINFWYLRRLFDPVLKPGARVLPRRAAICVAGIELPDLALSHGPVGSVLGFDHAPYDKRVGPRWHELLYPYPLRAYRHRLLTDTHNLLWLDYTALPTDVEATVTVPPTASGTLHAVAIWVDYELVEGGPTRTTFGVEPQKVGGDTIGVACSGDSESTSGGKHEAGHEKQMVRFLAKPVVVDVGREEAGGGGGGGTTLTVKGRFDVEGGCMKFDVSVG